MLETYKLPKNIRSRKQAASKLHSNIGNKLLSTEILEMFKKLEIQKLIN